MSLLRHTIRFWLLWEALSCLTYSVRFEKLQKMWLVALANQSLTIPWLLHLEQLRLRSPELCWLWQGLQMGFKEALRQWLFPDPAMRKDAKCQWKHAANCWVCNADKTDFVLVSTRCTRSWRKGKEIWVYYVRSCNFIFCHRWSPGVERLH